MISYAEETLDFSNGFSFSEFEKDRKTVAACVFNLSQIGELVKNIDEKVISEYENIEWKSIKNLRNKIVDDYEGIQLRRIWQIIEEDLRQLIKDLEEILNHEDKT